MLHDLDGSHCVGTLKRSEEIINVKTSSSITSSWCWRPSIDVSPTCQETEDFKCISHEIKRCLLLGEKAITNLDSILKSRDITLQTKVHIVKAMVFPVVMYGCESWTIKKAVCRRTDAFELWCWRRPLRVPWTTNGSNQSILKEINPDYSLEGLMLKLKV